MTARLYALTSLFVLAWTYAAARLDRATTGTVTGKVLRTVLQPGTAAPKFDGIEGVQVHVGSGLAYSQSDGTYTLFDHTFRDGIVRVKATVGNVTQEATAYKINVEDDGPSQLRFYENVATANLTFPPEQQRPPPPSVGVVIFKKKPDGSRERTDGLVVESDTLVIGFTTKDNIQAARINGEVYFVRREIDTPTKEVDWVLDRDFTPGRPGTFLIETTALGTDGSIADVAVTFRAIASGGSNNDTLHDEAPSVITLRTVPKNDAEGVPVDVFPQVTFTEPVVNVPGNVSLVDAAGQPVGFVLSGVGPDGPIADVSSAGAKLTSLTLQPMTGLKFGERYTLSLAAGIEDLDKDASDLPAPKNLVPFSSSFTTFGPESLGGTDDKFGSAGIVVLEDRAFLVENQFFNGTLRAFDITDPVEPQEIVEAQASVEGRPVDLAGEPGTVIVATGPTNRSRPSNILIFDVTSETQSRWVGAASVASSAIDMVGGVLALTDSGLLLSTARSPFGGDSELGGVRTAALRSIVYINSVVPDPIEVTRDDLVRRNVLVTFRALVDPRTIQSAVVDFVAPNRPTLRLSATMKGDSGEVTLAKGADLRSVRSLQAKAIINPGTDEVKASAPREVEVFKPRIAEMSFEYDHAPTFHDTGRTGPVLDGSGNVIRDPDDGPLSPNERANALPTLNASFRIILRDQRGNAFAEEEVAVLADNEELLVEGGNVKATDELGRVGSRIAVNADKVAENGKTRLTIVSGQTLRDLKEGKINEAQLKALSNEALTSKHENTGHSLRYERDIEELKAEVVSFEMPRFRQTDFIAALNSLVIVSGYDMPTARHVFREGQPPEAQITNRDPEKDSVLAQGWVIQSFSTAPQQYYPNRPDIEFHYEPIDPIRGPPGIENAQTFGDTALSGATLLTEVGIGLFPGGDFYEIAKQTVWKPLVQNEPADTAITLISFAGLLADGGYLAGPLGAIGNAGMAILKAVLEALPAGFVHLLIRGFSTAIEDITLLMGWVKSFAPVWTDAFSRFLELFNRISHQADVLLSSNIFIFRLETIAETTTRVLGKRAIALSDDAAIGVTRVVSEHGDDFARRIFADEFADQAETVGEAIVKLGPSVRLSREAIEAMSTLAKKLPNLKPDDLAKLRNVGRYGKDISDPLSGLTEDAEKLTNIVRAQWRLMEEASAKTGVNVNRLMGVAESNSFARRNVVFSPKGTKGVPDNLIVDGDIIKGAEEYKNFSPETWRRMREEVENLPEPGAFVEGGVQIDGTIFRVQFFQHRNTLRDLGVQNDVAEYVLKVADNVDLSGTGDVAVLVKLIEEEMGIRVRVEGMRLSTVEINELVNKLRID